MSGKAGVFEAAQFIMLVWPVGAPGWEMLDSLYLPSIGSRTPLRFIMRSKIERSPLTNTVPSPGPLVSKNQNSSLSDELHFYQTENTDNSNAQAQIHPLASTTPVASLAISDNTTTTIHQPMATRIASVSQFDRMTPLLARTAFEDTFKCSINDLLRLGNGTMIDSDEVKLFMYYPDDKAVLRGWIVRWLEKMDGWKVKKIYDSSGEGEWSLFTERLVKSGVVLVSSACSHLLKACVNL
jgi:hypothetical protein